MKAPKRMQTAFLVLLLCGIVFQPGPAQSSTQKTQTLEQALNPARLKVPALLSARVRIEEARALGGTASVGQPSVQVVETPLASKHAYGLAIAITSQSGKLTEGMNSICAVFLSAENALPVEVQNVGIEFTLLVGRNRGRPITTQLAQTAAGRYCGNVDLGPQHYFPANYDVVVRYVDAAAKKRKTSFGLSLRQK
jgi:hypothetical protein